MNMTWYWIQYHAIDIYVRIFGWNFNRDKTRANVLVWSRDDYFSTHLVERHGKPFKWCQPKKKKKKKQTKKKNKHWHIIPNIRTSNEIAGKLFWLPHGDRKESLS